MTNHDSKTSQAGERPTVEEAEAILTLVRGGWLKLELAVGDSNG